MRESGDLRDEVGGDRGEHQHEQEDSLTTPAIGSYAGEKAPDRTIEDHDGHEPRELDVRESELRSDRDAQNAEHHPYGEHESEGDCAERENPAPGGKFSSLRGGHRSRKVRLWGRS